MAHHEKGRREIVSLFRGAPSKRTRYAANPVCRRSSICEANSCRGFPLAGNGNIPYACGVTQVFCLPFSWCAIRANSLRGKLVCRRSSICEANSCRGFPLAGNGNIPYACGVTQVFRLPFSWCAIRANSLRGKPCLPSFVNFCPLPSAFADTFSKGRRHCPLPSNLRGKPLDLPPSPSGEGKRKIGRRIIKNDC